MLPRPQLSSWFWAIGAAGLVFAARLHEIHLHTGDVAINDQWKIEAADILLPWLNDTLRPWDFFAPHFEHVPLWTRLLVWVEVVLTGRWDPLVQTTVNAAFYAAFTALLIRWVTTNLPAAAALGITLLFVVGSSLPHAWENITWGFQSQFPLALLFLFLHVQGSLSHPAGSRSWWWAQGAGVAGLFTLAGMWMAPLAVVLVGVWTRTHDSRWRLFPLVLVVAGLGIILLIRATAPSYGAFAQTAGSPLHFVRALLDLLGWPAGWPGALVMLNLPLLLFALQLRGRIDSTPFDRTVLTLGIWAIGHAAALAFARSADYGGYVSRYGELLAVLVLANSLALCRVVPASRRWRSVSLLFALAWTGVVLTGWWQLSTGGHTAYFHENSAPRAQLRRDALQAYLLHQDRALLEQPSTRWVLYQDVDQVTRLLDQPDFRALLPASINPANPTDLIGTWARTVQSHARTGAGLAGGIFLTGIILGWRRPSGTHALPTFKLQPERMLPWLAAATAIAATSLLFRWPAPLTFGSAARWRLFFLPPESVGPLSFHVVTGSQPLPADRLVGAAPVSPREVRDLLSGTHPEGPELTCTAWSEPFPITSPWLIVPHAGWPVSHGNGLRLRIEQHDGTFVTEVSCEGPNPREIGFWAAQVEAYRGMQARVVLYDGRTGDEGWVAAAPPIAVADSAAATRMARALSRERLASAHQALGWIALGSTGVFGLWIATRRLSLRVDPS